jgi:hypothetical protein
MEDEQDLVAAVLRSTPPPHVRGDFVARVNARIDATAGWFGLADFRAWTLRLAPAAAALALAAVFWSAPASATTSSPGPDGGSTSTATGASSFSPASTSDWQQDVTGDALLEAALTTAGSSRAR